jgi:hypothetical protein
MFLYVNMEKKINEVCNDTDLIGYSFICPGCNHYHIFYVKGNLCWNFNGNLESPTFEPSLLNTWTIQGESKCCHLNLTNGVLYFHGDSYHSMAGKTFPLPTIID